MPRLKVNRLEYMAQDFVKWLAGEMLVRDLTQEHIGNYLNISQQAVSSKMRNYSFTYGEKMELFEQFGASHDTRVRLLI